MENQTEKLVSVRLVLLAAWVGAAVFFSATVAPAAFGVLRGANLAAPDELAGAIVNRTLSIINFSGFIVGLLLLLGAVLFTKLRSGAAWWGQIFGLAIVTLATACGQWWIAPQMERLRAQAGRPLAELTANNSVRVGFDYLHQLSVTLLSAAMLAAIATLFFLALKRTPSAATNELSD